MVQIKKMLSIKLFLIYLTCSYSYGNNAMGMDFPWKRSSLGMDLDFPWKRSPSVLDIEIPRKRSTLGMDMDFPWKRSSLGMGMDLPLKRSTLGMDMNFPWQRSSLSSGWIGQVRSVYIVTSFPIHCAKNEIQVWVNILLPRIFLTEMVTFKDKINNEDVQSLMAADNGVSPCNC